MVSNPFDLSDRMSNTSIDVVDILLADLFRLAKPRDELINDPDTLDSPLFRTNLTPLALQETISANSIEEQREKAMAAVAAVAGEQPERVSFSDVAFFFDDENRTVKRYAGRVFKHVANDRPGAVHSHLSAVLNAPSPDYSGQRIWETALNIISRQLLLGEQGSEDNFPGFIHEVLHDSELELWEVGNTLGTTAAEDLAFLRALLSHSTADDPTTRRAVAEAISTMAEDWRYLQPNNPPTDLAPTFRAITAGLNTDDLHTIGSLARAISHLVAFHEMRCGRRKGTPYHVVPADSDTTGTTVSQDVDDFVTHAADVLAPCLRLTPEQAHVKPPHIGQPPRGATSIDARVPVLSALNVIARFDPKVVVTHLTDLQEFLLRLDSGDNTNDRDVSYMLTTAGRILIYVVQARAARVASQL